MTVPIDELWKLVQCCIRFPYPQICKHSVACDILDVIERHGGLVTEEIADAIIQCRDEDALRLIGDGDALRRSGD